MTTKTISTYIAAGYSLKAAYSGLDITTSGGIGGTGLYAGAAAAVVNAGRIRGSGEGVKLAAGGSVTNQSGAQISGVGGGVYLAGAGTVSNAGSIGGTSTTFGDGGGVWLQAGGAVTNTGSISSLSNYGVGLHAGGSVTNKAGGAITSGLVGVYLGSLGGGAGGGTVANGGAISGRYDGILAVGGSATVTNGGVIGGVKAATIDGLRLGVGVALNAGGRVLNQAGGSISGARYGVYVAGAGTVTNFGAIGGTGGVAVEFKAASDRLIVEAGAHFAGKAVGGGGTLEVAGGTGTITGIGAATGSLAGGAALKFSGFGAWLIDAGATWTTAGVQSLASGRSLGVGGVLRGAGTIGGAGKVFTTKKGILEATGTLTLSAGAIANAGTLEAAAGGVLTVKNAVANTGVLLAHGGTLTLDKAVTGTGTAQIDGGTLDAASTFTENVAFKGTTGVMELAHSVAYAGKVSGLSLTGKSSLDLLDIKFVSKVATTASFASNAAHTFGVLSVTDGTHTAKITLIGDYFGKTFTTSSDGHGGTKVIDPAAPLGPFIAAMAAFGACAGPGPAPAAAASWRHALTPLLSAPRTIPAP